MNMDKPDRWKRDIGLSVDAYNRWFVGFAPKTFQKSRSNAIKDVADVMKKTDNMMGITPDVLCTFPGILRVLRMSACPPLAADRLAGLAGVKPGRVKSMKQGGADNAERADMRKIAAVVNRMLDPDIFSWVKDGRRPTAAAANRAATVVADRLCGTLANPIIRNAQEKRQLNSLRRWLKNSGYAEVDKGARYNDIKPGTFLLGTNIPVRQTGGSKVNMQVDAAIAPKDGKPGVFPVLIEAKSSGDYANVNKRRKEEATKALQLRSTYGRKAVLTLLLGGYFDGGYLGYEAAEGMDWVWEHRLDDLREAGL